MRIRAALSDLFSRKTLLAMSLMGLLVLPPLFYLQIYTGDIMRLAGEVEEKQALDDNSLRESAKSLYELANNKNVDKSFRDGMVSIAERLFVSSFSHGPIVSPRLATLHAYMRILMYVIALTSMGLAVFGYLRRESVSTAPAGQ